MANAVPLDTIAPVESPRLAEGDVDPLFIGRWSTRAFSPEPIPKERIASLFEAARWAPSASNLQPWLFVYASDAASLERARALLREPNRRWAGSVPLLIFVFARRLHP